MKKFSPLLLAASIAVLSGAMTSSAMSINTKILVNTLVDEYGENPEACSLREAIKTNNDMKAFGGCQPGDRYLQNTILLTLKGTYALDPKYGEFVISRDVKIEGVDTSDPTKVDPLTNIHPLRHLPESIIDANSKSRIFNTTSLNSALTLTAVILQNGGSPTFPERGGAILAGGVVSLGNVVLRNNQATVEGGAIYVSGKSATVNTNASTLENNYAPVGAVLSMSCLDNLYYTARGIEMVQTAILNNGDGANQSVIEACGSASLAMTTTTITGNKAVDSTAHGGIVRFSKSPGASGTMSLRYVTAVENQTAPVFAFEGLDSVSLATSVIAFNNGGGCKDYSSPSSTIISGDENTLEQCPLPFKAEAKNSVIDGVAGVSMATEFSGLDYHGGLSKNFLPLTTSKYVIDTIAGCQESSDQRGALRAPFIKCDRGAVERKQLTAVDEPNSTNKSGTDRIIRAMVLSNDIAPETDTDRPVFNKDFIADYELIPFAPCKLGTLTDISADNTIPFLEYDSHGIPRNDKCDYQIKQKSTGLISNKGTVNLEVVNIPPKAEDDSVTLPSGAVSVSLDVLANDNDSGDGKYGRLYCNPVPPSSTSTPPEPGALEECSTTPAYNIRLVDKPAVGYITAQYQGPCPDNSVTSVQTCYGGPLTYHPSNTLSPFADKFTYVVLDRNLSESNTATVTINNSAPADGKQAGNLGITGGSMGWFSLAWLGLMGLVRSFNRRKNA
ncbi:putative secreted protein/CSLREA domain-containing protein [Fluviicoccus keumensis]|uniref:Putative secreted protein/CSLREA domain-containing protein n=1 Tax=Fluviicoccus keumensis TaxID=1435465 RepID=A0A4Q7Z625_9GAMM|nr:CSLREA domain-containing protein [Fluviicoccus keumensis]RZU45321.1 putative secreted protein/CSLREA domain-containing protein [Fluviicoccus keumensis]